MSAKPRKLSFLLLILMLKKNIIICTYESLFFRKRMTIFLSVFQCSLILYLTVGKDPSKMCNFSNKNRLAIMM